MDETEYDSPIAMDQTRLVNLTLYIKLPSL